MKLLVPLLLVFLTACSSTYMVQSDPPGAKVKIDGEYVGVTPVQHESKCTTFGQLPRINVSKDGFKSESAQLEYRLSLLNIVSESILFWPLLFVNAECPKTSYLFRLDEAKL